MTTVLAPIEFDAPLLNPSPTGLHSATTFTEETGAPRWLAAGVRIRVHNFGGEQSFGLWDTDWCLNPDQLSSDEETGLKTGVRPEFLDAFEQLTVWSSDQTQCGDLSAASQAARARGPDAAPG